MELELYIQTSIPVHIGFRVPVPIDIDRDPLAWIASQFEAVLAVAWESFVAVPGGADGRRPVDLGTIPAMRASIQTSHRMLLSVVLSLVTRMWGCRLGFHPQAAENEP